MRGELRIYRPGNPAVAKVRVLDRAAGLEDLQGAIDGGLIEVVSFLRKVVIEGASRPCIAFCDEEGKLKHLSFNEAATKLWVDALGGHPLTDVLVGPVVVCVGDTEFLRSL